MVQREPKKHLTYNLNIIVNSIPHNDKIVVLGDFNACVRSDFEAWNSVLDCHDIGKENSSSTVLLNFC